MSEPNPSLEEHLFEVALTKASAAERTAFLDGVCRDNPSLRARLDVLLEGHFQAEGFLADATKKAEPKPAAPPTELPSEHIGRYKILQQIGEGGCGIVYMAEQQEPVRRRVALKVIKLGMDTKQVIARFGAERQALALMDHPNIAKVLDAGATETGRPYFVMDLVKGVPITRYCDENTLTAEQRLQLFIQVCQAVQHAHQKGVIHRDLKPSNILVADHDGTAVPKIIDFGIAKATTDQRLTDKTLFTALEQFIGTPAYMSPEQAKLSGLDVDTRSDIYSLGVLLYELLTGKTPFDPKRLLEAGLDEIRRTIQEMEPVPPSTRLSSMSKDELTTTAHHRGAEPPRLISLVRGDLDWIVMKCLEKDRGRRYETANGLARDIERHLRNEPVTARPPSRLYEFQKTVRRHWVGFSAVSAILFSLVVGMGVATLEFFSERRAERAATAEAAKSRQVAQFLEDMLSGVDPNVAVGRDTTILRDILDKTAERVGKDLKSQPEAEAELLYTIGHIYLDLRLLQKAETAFREALRLRKQATTENPPAVFLILNELADAVRRQNRFPEAEQLRRESLAVARRVPGPEGHRDVAAALNGLAIVLQNEGKREQGEAAHRQALAIVKKFLPENGALLAYTMDNLGVALWTQGNFGEGASMLEEALVLNRKLFGDTNTGTAIILTHKALMLEEQQRYADAEVIFRQVLAMRRQICDRDHPDVVTSTEQLARVLAQEGKTAEAELLYREALGSFTRTLSAKNAGELLLLLPPLWECISRQGKQGEWQTLFNSVISTVHPYLEQDDLHTGMWPGQQIGVDRAAECSLELAAAGDLVGAESLARECLRIREKRTPGGWKVSGARSLLGRILVEQKKYTEAEPLLVAGCEGMKLGEGPIAPTDRQNLRAALLSLVRLYKLTARPAQASMAAAELRQQEARASRKSIETGDLNSLNDVAWFLATCPESEVRDGSSAVSYALEAVAKTNRKNVAYLDTLAAAYAEDAQFPTAVSVQKEAIALLQDSEAKRDFESRLMLYQANKPYREP